MKFKGLWYRNVDYIISQEAELFKRIGMEKVGFEGVNANIITGGNVWYMAKFPERPEHFTIKFVSFLGHVRLDYMRQLNPKLGDGT